MTKEETIYLRLTAELRRQLDAEAERRGEALSVIVREALREYFERKPGNVSVPDVASSVIRPTERPELNEPVSYRNKRKP
jgi:hypothetical protein